MAALDGHSEFRRVRRPQFIRRLPLLDLSALVKLVPPQSQRAGSAQDVQVERIVGSEDRSEDFWEGFVPRHDWMGPRWAKVFDLLRGPGIPEPLQLVEYGGFYFVRDGHHRVSVAKEAGIAYLYANVVHFHIPVQLPPLLNVRNLEVLVEKAAFQERTRFFDHADDVDFPANKASTWRRLEAEVFVHAKAWADRTNKRGMEVPGRLIRGWLPFYKATVEHLRNRGLMMLFPGSLEADVFVELVDYWNSLEDPASVWVGDAYLKFERSVRRKHRLRALLLRATRLSHAPTPSQSRRFFLSATRLQEYVEGFEPPQGSPALYALFYRQVFRDLPKLWRKAHQDQPEMRDVAVAWFSLFYGPVVARYRARLPVTPFEVYYRRFSRASFEGVVVGSLDVGQALDQFDAIQA